MTIHDPRYSDVIIIGGGATGAGIARDCALRGLSVTLLERHDIATGATGRNHGLLHSGARYAVTDGESARECIAENQILKRIAKHRIFTKPHRIFCAGIIAIFFDKFFLRMNGISVCLAADFIAVNHF